MPSAWHFIRAASTERSPVKILSVPHYLIHSHLQARKEALTFLSQGFGLFSPPFGCQTGHCHILPLRVLVSGNTFTPHKARGD